MCISFGVNFHQLDGTLHVTVQFISRCIILYCIALLHVTWLAQDLPSEQPALDYVLDRAREHDPSIKLEAGRKTLGALGLTGTMALRNIGERSSSASDLERGHKVFDTGRKASWHCLEP